MLIVKGDDDYYEHVSPHVSVTSGVLGSGKAGFGYVRDEFKDVDLRSLWLSAMRGL